MSSINVEDLRGDLSNKKKMVEGLTATQVSLYLILESTQGCADEGVHAQDVSDLLHFHGGGGGLVAQSCRILVTPWTVALLCPWGSPGKNTGVGCHFLLGGSSSPRNRTWVSCIAGR